jgi:hypothetical protein
MPKDFPSQYECQDDPRKELAEAKAEIERLGRHVRCFEMRIDNLQAENGRLKAVLKFWANESEWCNVPVEFQIKRARELLASLACDVGDKKT